MKDHLTSDLAVVISCASLFGLSMGVTIPLVSLNLEHQNVNSSLIGVMAAMPSLGIMFCSPFMPVLVNWFGGRRAMLLAMAMGAVSVLALVVFKHYGVWLLLRFLMGAAAALLFVISETWINEVAEEHNRGRLIGLYLTALSLCYGGGPLVISLTGSQGALPFVIAGLIYLLSAIPLVLSKAQPPAISDSSSFGVWGFMRVAPTIALGVLLVTILDGSTASLLPVFGLRHDYPEGLAAAMITVLIGANTLSQLPLGWLADRMDRLRLIFICGLGVLIGSLCLPFVVSSWLFWFVLMFLGVAAGGVYTLSIVLLGQRFRGSELMTANAAIGVLWGLGGIIGAPLAGLSMQIYNPDGLPLFWALVAAIFIAIFIYRRRMRRGG